jgi:hypothetical protein
MRISRAIQIGHELLVIQPHALLLEALRLKCGCVLLSYPYLDVPDDPVADDETYLRLMAFHPDRVIHIREELQVSRQLHSGAH